LIEQENAKTNAIVQNMK